MSENGILHASTGKPQLKRQKQNVDSVEADDENLTSLSLKCSPKSDVVAVSEKDERRHSSASSDSQKSVSKKPASLNEIQDLYSALQDLVKTNVSTTPLPERRAKLLAAGSPGGSPRLGERTLTVPERQLQKLSSRISPSSSFDKENSVSSEESKHLKHKRGLSTGTMEAVANLMRISPFPTRKFSHDIESANGTNKNNKKSSAKNGSPSSGKKERCVSTGDQKKWKGARLFKRLRSKSNAELSEDDQINEEGAREKNRRRSEADALRLQRNREKGLTPPQRKSLQEDSSKELEQLVSTLSIQEDNSNKNKSFLQAPTASYVGNPINDLNKLESWFENALTHNSPTNKYVINDRSASNDGTSPKVRNQRFRKKNGGKIVRRASSNTATSQRIKEERRDRRNHKSSKSFDATNGMVYAKSTPNLSKTRLSLDDNDEDIDRALLFSEQLENNSPSPLSSQSKASEHSSHDKKIQRDRRLTGRLPDSPVFYVPPSTDTDTNDTSQQVKPLLRKHSEAPMFYTKEEETNNIKNLLSPLQDENQRTKSVSGRRSGGSSPTHDTNFKNSRPKSMFIYSDQNPVIDGVIMTSSEESETSKKNSFDSNANLCRGKIINTAPHRLSLCDLSKTTVTIGGQEKTLWDKFRKVTGNKKAKACKSIA